MDATRQIALDHVATLFRLAQEVVQDRPELAQSYITTSRKIAMKTRLRLPKEYRRMICRHCKSFILPGLNCRVRIQPRREPHVVVTCLECGEHTRIPLRR